MSEHITHTAVMDDCARLALHSEEICEDFKTVLLDKLEICRYAAMTRSGDNFTVRLLRNLRDHWPNRRAGDLAEEKLAFLLGWRCHLAADRTFKPVYRILDPQHYLTGDDEEGETSDVSIYHDVVVFREVYGNGTRAPFSPAALDFRLESHPAWRALPVRALERLFLPLWQGELLRIQSRRDLSNFQSYRITVMRYSSAFYAPDPDKMRRYIIEPNFYNPNDPLIALARSLQQGSPRQDINLRDALSSAPRQSQYAQALERGYRYLHAASEYFLGRIDELELQRRCDVGKPHVPPELDPKRRKS
jgi:hypothetical protein